MFNCCVKNCVVIQYIMNMPEHAAGRVHPVITPRFVPTCSSKLMFGLGNLAKQTGAFIQSHVSENKAEIEWVKELVISRFRLLLFLFLG